MKQIQGNGRSVPPTPTFPVAEETARALLEAHPALADPTHRRLLAWAVFGDDTFHNENSDGGTTYERVTLRARRLAQFEEQESVFQRKKYVGSRFLERHREAFPTFDWTGWQPGQWPRQVRRDGLTAELVDLLESDLRVPVSSRLGPAIDLLTWAPVPAPTSGAGAIVRRQARELAITQADALNATPMCPEQAALLGLLNSAPPQTISRLVSSNAEGAAREALGVTSKHGVRSPLRYGLRAAMDLRRVQYQPFSPYARARSGRTVRVFPVTHPSVVSARSPVRRSILSGCWECDLTNAQLACAASSWGVRPLLRLLGDEGSAWPHLLRVVREAHGLAGAQAKTALKPATYAAVFGMEERAIRWMLGRRLTFEAADRFLADPIVADLLEKRNDALAEIEANGGATDCFGVRYSLDGYENKAKGCRSVLAALMTAEELRLLLPVVEDALHVASHERPRYRVVAWQHDGFAIRARSDGAAVVQRLQRAVEAEGARLGVYAALEAEKL